MGSAACGVGAGSVATSLVTGGAVVVSGAVVVVGGAVVVALGVVVSAGVSESPEHPAIGPIAATIPMRRTATRRRRP
ncbi:hypothetical protein Rrhod_4260 [Rhodococcus rhodnii LMG 5362]|uniref:Uncharacterized protein n=1 Tax=Rhodococcus rhodnii LMG 5362 TaxID=1273125 RepID=R7WH78_9NOCA|nr:hypothetical protein Rrhod_4260 [Rhodococcus rhodnii LMG 5362]